LGKDTTLFQPDELPPVPAELSFDNELFRALSVQQHYTEIDVQLIPKTLMMEEVDFIETSGQKSITDSKFRTTVKKKPKLYADYLNKFALPPLHG
jgi:hypothetical protein